MIACVSPTQICVEETINTLNYATRAKNIKRKITKNIKDLSNNLESSFILENNDKK